MAASFSLIINDSSGKSSADLSARIGRTPSKHFTMVELLNYLTALSTGCGAASIDLSISTSSSTLAAASGTVTCASVLAADTVTVNGVVFTAVNGSPTGNQFDMSGTDTATAASLVSAINASVTALIGGYVTAANVAGVVTITAVQKGTPGNLVTLASSNSTRLLTSGARLTGGVGGFSSTVTTYAYDA